MSARDKLPANKDVLADAERIIPVMRHCLRRGGTLLQQNAGYRNKPTVLIDAPRSARLIKELKANGAESVGKQYGENGKQLLWHAEIDGCLVQWWEAEVL
ncbi:hypothetical protein [Chitinibacter sp. S2-10]|uniref:hypothetical protein n=1 Tax=Chitinibacter sp. S2-10 TaxID=3373597 RepID=UPI003977700B